MKTNSLLNLKPGACMFGFLVLLACLGCHSSNKMMPPECADFHGTEDLKKAYENFTNPLPERSLDFMKAYFRYAYLLNGVNANLDTPSIEITPTILNSFINMDTLRRPGYWLAVHYVTVKDPENPTRRYFSYALSLAKKDMNDDWQHAGLTINNGQNQYLLLLKDSVRPIETLEFNTCRGFYEQIYNQSFTCDSAKRTIASMDDSSHALSCYHDGPYFASFYEDNFEHRTIDVASWKIKFDHGAIHLNIMATEKYWVQTPLIYFVNGAGVPQVGGQLCYSNPFRNMLLDLGHLCPPDCNK